MALALLFFFLVLPLAAQQTEQPAGMRPCEHAMMFGVGRSNVYDSYLSPLNHPGVQITALRETGRFLKSRNEALPPRISFQSLWQTDLSLSQASSSTADYIAGNIAYDAGWHYNWHNVLPGLRLMAGGQVGGSAGFLYTTRSANNPANARVQLRLTASLAAHYECHIGRLPLHLRYQADLPLLGLAFAPNYGQSYFELSEYGTDHNVGFISPANALSLRQLLTIDFRFRRCTLRLGYLANLRQMEMNGLRQHHYAHSLVVGWTKRLWK